VTEAELLAEVLELCRRYGLWWFHAYDSRRMVRGDTDAERIQAGKGWVDLVIVGRSGALFAELKSEQERRSRAQIHWADRLVKAGQTYRLWRPDDLTDKTIAKELEAIR
jgi:hypothetical protein